MNAWILGYVKDEQNPMTALKVGGDNGPVSLLPCRIPDVQFDGLAFNVHIFDSEVDCCDLSGLFL